MDNLPLNIDTHPGSKSGQVVMALNGPLTLFNLFNFQNALRAEKSPVLILDFSGVPYMDSAGLGAIVNAHVSCANGSRKLALSALPERVLKMIQISRVDQVLAIFPTLAEAEEKLA
jgi:anti-sigma B factor antagonist